MKELEFVEPELTLWLDIIRYKARNYWHTWGNTVLAIGSAIWCAVLAL